MGYDGDPADGMKLRAAAAAAGCYVAVGLWALRVVLPAPASTFPYSTAMAPEPVTAMSMFGDGLLGVVPWVLTQSPIATMNTVSPLALVLPALTMYALVAHFTLPYLQTRRAGAYRHVAPIVPTRVLLRWYADGGALAAEQRTRLLLPLALAPGEEARRTLVTGVPTGPGRYEVTVVAEAAPERVLSRQRVEAGPS